MIMRIRRRKGIRRMLQKSLRRDLVKRIKDSSLMVNLIMLVLMMKMKILKIKLTK
jgi:hypothetical protein